jgi:predicted ATPase
LTRLRLELLGGFSVLVGDTPRTLPTRKAQALLAYLALPPGRFHPRDKLTALLWGDTGELQARQSFRQALARLKKRLADIEPEALLVRGDAIALNPEAVAVDVSDFETAVADGRREALERAALLYKGDLLEGLGVDETPFEEWRTVQRERLHELALETMARLLAEDVRTGRLEPAVRAALRLLALDPLEEAVHRTLMRLLFRQGRRAAALQQYQRCVGALQRELGTEPEEETRELYRQILRAASTAVEEAAPPAMGAGRATVPLVGRTPELGRLRDALTRMLDGGGLVTLVTGEAGIGKSRLIQEFVSEAIPRGVRVILVRCYETEQALPLRPWSDALRGNRPALDPSTRDRLGTAASAQLGRVFPELLSAGEQPVTTGAQPVLLFEALAELVGRMVADQPMVLIIEDLHWADAMSARFLAFLGRQIQRMQALIVGTMRPEDLVDVPMLVQAAGELRSEGRLEEIALSPLSEAESRALARALRPSSRLGRDWEQAVSRIWTESEGNPFVIVESVRALSDEATVAGGGDVRPARRVSELVAARLDRLDRVPRHVVAAAAAIGRDFAFELLSRAAGLGEAESAEAVEELVRRRILDAVGERLAFCHDWIRQVAYERTLEAKRRVLHAAIGEALEERHAGRLDEVADQLGHHYQRAGDTRKAILYLLQFARLATGRYALDDASRAFGQALAVVDRLPPPERDRQRLGVALRQAFLLSVLGRQREIMELLESQASHVERVEDAQLLSEYFFRLGLTRYFLGAHGESQRAGERALREGERSGDPVCAGKALHVLSLNAFDAGRPREGAAAAARAIPLLDRPDTQEWLGLAYHDLSLNSVMAGALDAALDAARHAEGLGRAHQWPRVQALAGCTIAWVHTLKGDATLAVEAARRSLDLSRDPMAASLVSGALGHACLESGDARSAVSLLSQVVEQLQRSPVRHAQIRHTVQLSEALLLSGDGRRAREMADQALELARTAGMPFNIGSAERALGRIACAAGEHARAAELFIAALATFLRCDAAFEAAQTRADLAIVRAEQGETDAAQDDLAAAITTFEAANAPKRAAQARARARAVADRSP